MANCELNLKGGGLEKRPPSPLFLSCVFPTQGEAKCTPFRLFQKVPNDWFGFKYSDGHGKGAAARECEGNRAYRVRNHLEPVSLCTAEKIGMSLAGSCSSWERVNDLNNSLVFPGLKKIETALSQYTYFQLSETLYSRTPSPSRFFIFPWGSSTHFNV